MFRVAAAVLTTLLATDGGAAELVEVAEKVKPTVAMLVAYDSLGVPQSIGTGFFVSADGRMITNHHVIDDAGAMVAIMPNGDEFEVRGVLGLDVRRDLALLQVEGQGHPFLEIGDSRDLKEGVAVGIFGAPLGLSWTLSHGTVSAIDNQPELARGESNRAFDRIIQVSGSMMGEGNSGSPVFDMNARVLAVIFGGIGESGGTSFAVPVEAVQELLAQSGATPMAFEEERAVRAINERSRNALISAALLLSVGGYFGYRGIRRRLLQRRLAELEAQLDHLN